MSRIQPFQHGSARSEGEITDARTQSQQLGRGPRTRPEVLVKPATLLRGMLETDADPGGPSIYRF